MSKAKISDVRQGVTLYHVRAFPHRGDPSTIEAIVVTDRAKPYKSGEIFTKVKCFYNDALGWGSYTRPFSLKDAGIIANKYNFHRSFTSQKAAKRYADRMDRVCLTAAERVKFDKKRDCFMIWNTF